MKPSLPKVNLARWRPHVLAALQAGQSFAAYAREHQLSRHSLYVAHMHLKAAGEVAQRRAAATMRPSRTAADANAFVPVRVSAESLSPLQLTVQLANDRWGQCH
jgi:hypothetical protein